MTHTVTLVLVRATREPYRRAGIDLGKATLVFALSLALATEAIAGIDPKFGRFSGTLTQAQFAQLSGDQNVLIETREVTLADGVQKAEAEPLTTEQDLDLVRLIVETVDPLILREGFKPTAADLKGLLKPVRAALDAAGFKADKVEHVKTEAGFDLIAHYGDQTVRVTFSLPTTKD